MTTIELLERTKAAWGSIRSASAEEKDRLLLAMAESLEANSEDILRENAKDMEAAKGTISDVMLDRLALTESRIHAMAEGIREAAALPDHVGRALAQFKRPNGMTITKRQVPLGLVAIIYESRPNVTSDAAALCIKSGNVCMLRSGKDKLYSYTKKEEERTVETVTTSVTVDASTGKETTTETVTTTTEKWIIYTVSYNGEAYFADEVFHLTAEQKDLADDYAYNLSLFLGDSMFQGLPAGYTTVSSLGNIRFTDGQTAVVYFNQLDERYAGQPYGTDNIGGYGCGPTAMSIVVSSLANDTVDPIEMARWSYENGYWCSGSGSYHALIPAAAKAWGLNVEGCSASDGQKIADALADGKLVVAIMLKGHFTSSGHFIVLRGVKDGKILVADPASYDRSSMEWDLSIILNEASTHAGAGGPFWIIG